jgi:MFS transporter, DHA3 family, macrolide efflux protein
VYVAGLLSNALDAFQEPAFRASVSLLVPKAQLTRANAMLSLADDGSRMFAPMLAGMLLLFIGVKGIMALDITAGLVAVGLVMVNRIPQPQASAEGKAARGDWAHELTFGFRYIARHAGLLGILVIFTLVNLFAALTYFGVLPAMILARSGHSEMALGVVQSVLGVGGVAGGLLLSLWGGPKKRLPAFLWTNAAAFLLGDFLFAIGRSLPAWVVAAFFSAVFIPFILSCYESIWQACVAHDVQGRVLSAKNMIQVGSMPLGYLLAGVLADRVFEPAMAAGGSLTGVFGPLVGTGPGAGMGLMFVCTCVLGLATSLSGFLIPAVRRVEENTEAVTQPALP